MRCKNKDAGSNGGRALERSEAGGLGHLQEGRRKATRLPLISRTLNLGPRLAWPEWKAKANSEQRVHVYS